MKIILYPQAATELEDAYYYLESQSEGLGDRLTHEFRRGVDQIISFPHAWQAMDNETRRYRLNSFPYGIVYSISVQDQTIRIETFADLRSEPR